MVWCGVVWRGVFVMAWCGVVWCGVAWCGVVCYGLVWCGLPPRTHATNHWKTLYALLLHPSISGRPPRDHWLGWEVSKTTL